MQAEDLVHGGQVDADAPADGDDAPLLAGPGAEGDDGRLVAAAHPTHLRHLTDRLIDGSIDDRLLTLLPDKQFQLKRVDLFVQFNSIQFFISFHKELNTTCTVFQIYLCHQ